MQVGAFPSRHLLALMQLHLRLQLPDHVLGHQRLLRQLLGPRR
jgi:hypothetical protein